jgi:hypothetical protein
MQPTLIGPLLEEESINPSAPPYWTKGLGRHGPLGPSRLGLGLGSVGPALGHRRLFPWPML